MSNETAGKWYDRPWAALIFFTRLPLWRIHQPPGEAYRAVPEFWPLAGWVTAGVMAGVLYGASRIFPYEVAVVLAIASRQLLTGALHEDGLADFFDGFGGGRDRQHILDIMKDSHIGTYGTLALIVYLATLYTALHSLPPADAAVAILVLDPYAKMLSARAVQTMPYARTEATAKNKTVYRRPPAAATVGLALQGLLPLAACPWAHISWAAPLLLPWLTMYTLRLLIRRRLQGYTGDCCGALFLLVELTGYLAAVCGAN